MARQGKTYPDFKGFVQIDLNEADITAIMETAQKPVSVWNMVVNACKDGFKITIQPDADTLMFKATLTDNNTSRTSAGWMLSGQGPDVLTAVTALMYKHVQKMNGVWTPFLTTGNTINSIR